MSWTTPGFALNEIAMLTSGVVKICEANTNFPWMFMWLKDKLIYCGRYLIGVLFIIFHSYQTIFETTSSVLLIMHGMRFKNFQLVDAWLVIIIACCLTLRVVAILHIVYLEAWSCAEIVVLWSTYQSGLLEPIKTHITNTYASLGRNELMKISKADHTLQLKTLP